MKVMSKNSETCPFETCSYLISWVRVFHKYWIKRRIHATKYVRIECTSDSINDELSASKICSIYYVCLLQTDQVDAREVVKEIFKRKLAKAKAGNDTEAIATYSSSLRRLNKVTHSIKLHKGVNYQSFIPWILILLLFHISAEKDRAK